MIGQHRMKAYQLELSERMQNAAVCPSAAVLGVTIGNDRWLVAMEKVREVLPLVKLTPIALTKPWFLGVANVRGDLYGIADLAIFLGGEATPRNHRARILLASQQFGVNSGLLVGNMLGIRSLTDFEPIKNTNQEKKMAVAGCYLDKEERLWYELNLGELISNPGFIQIAG